MHLVSVSLQLFRKCSLHLNPPTTTMTLSTGEKYTQMKWIGQRHKAY